MYITIFNSHYTHSIKTIDNGERRRRQYRQQRKRCDGEKIGMWNEKKKHEAYGKFHTAMENVIKLNVIQRSLVFKQFVLQPYNTTLHIFVPDFKYTNLTITVLNLTFIAPSLNIIT